MSSTTDATPDGEDVPDVAPPVPLEEPAEGVPAVVESERTLDEAAEAVAAGIGPVAIDAERASGYRYGQRAYLVQVRREGAGTWLIDPIAVPDLTPLADAIGPAEWILHAATQDLACLAEVGLRPRQLFDTELAARILGLPRVGLAAVVEHYLGLRLAKEHSAVDWSTRPLPDPWLRYAALDVEVLGELRNLMGVDLATQGKAEWARQEFAALLVVAPHRAGRPVAPDVGHQHAAVAPGRRPSSASSGTPATTIARDRDISVGRVLPDAALVEIAREAPTHADGLPCGHRAIKRYGRQWVEAVRPRRGDPRGRAAAARRCRRTARRRRGCGPTRTPSPPRGSRPRRAALTAFAEERTIPVENVCSPDPLRRVVWSPPEDRSVEGFAAALDALGVRRWQAEIVAPMLADAAAAHPDA